MKVRAGCIAGGAHETQGLARCDRLARVNRDTRKVRIPGFAAAIMLEDDEQAVCASPGGGSNLARLRSDDRRTHGSGQIHSAVHAPGACYRMSAQAERTAHSRPGKRCVCRQISRTPKPANDRPISERDQHRARAYIEAIGIARRSYEIGSPSCRDADGTGIAVRLGQRNDLGRGSVARFILLRPQRRGTSEQQPGNDHVDLATFQNAPLPVVDCVQGRMQRIELHGS